MANLYDNLHTLRKIKDFYSEHCDKEKLNKEQTTELMIILVNLENNYSSIERELTYASKVQDAIEDMGEPDSWSY